MRRVAFVVLAACASTPAPTTAPAPAAAPAAAPAPVATPEQPLPSAPTQASPTQSAATAKPKWLGVMLEPGTTHINQVLPGSPAQKAGVVVGDEVTTIAGKTVGTSADLIAVVQTLGDKPAELVLQRGSKSLTLKITVEDRPDTRALGQSLVNKKAPDFAVTTLDGKTVKLGDLSGHIVVVDFWATWCGPCIASIPYMNKLHKKYPDVNMVAISNEDQPDISAFLADHNITYTIARDESLGATRDYLVQALPTTIVIDDKGIIRHIEIGVGDPNAIEKVVVSLRPKPSP
ncbi:MAG TPA: redoxin domain-containing protein [Kofleriaceae bacterium]|nr:redoxin domain-containing protein [Kofleriaceae bacterium]